jgi:hypothetical protein
VLVHPRPPTGRHDAPEPELSADAVAPSPFDTAIPSATQGGSP